MKKMVTKTCALLLMVWYCISIIGFDVHTCSESGRSFVATFLKGMTCEAIHPEHAHDSACCHETHEHICCGHHHHGSDACLSVNTKSCCSDDYQVLILTGERPDDDHRHYDECGCGHCPCIEGAAMVQLPAVPDIGLLKYHGGVPGLIVYKDFQSSLSVWRI